MSLTAYDLAGVAVAVAVAVSLRAFAVTGDRSQPDLLANSKIAVVAAVALPSAAAVDLTAGARWSRRVGAGPLAGTVL